MAVGLAVGLLHVDHGVAADVAVVAAAEDAAVDLGHAVDDHPGLVDEGVVVEGVAGAVLARDTTARAEDASVVRAVGADGAAQDGDVALAPAAVDAGGDAGSGDLADGGSPQHGVGGRGEDGAVVEDVASHRG